MNRKKFVLVVVPSFENAYHRMSYFAGKLPHLGLAVIAGTVERMGYEVKIIDADAEDLDFDAAIARVVAEKPAWVGASSMTAVMDIAGGFFAELKARLPGLKIVVGGPHMSAIPLHAMQQFQTIDYGVVGEGDITIQELLRAVDDGQGDLADVRGLAYRRNGQPVLTPERPVVEDLGTTAPPAFHLLDFSKYRSYGFHGWSDSQRTPLGVMTMSRGCFGKCNFCAVDSVFGAGTRFFPMKMIQEQLDTLINKHNVKIINFLDDTFTHNRRMVNQICDYILEKGYHRRTQFMVGTRVDAIHVPTLIKMRRANFTWVGFGVESGSRTILERMGKHISLEQIRNAFQVTNDLGFFVTGNFMIGHLGETMETAMETIDLACELGQDYTSIAIAIPFPGTELYQHALDKGIQLPSWNDFGNVNSPPIPLNDSLDAEQLMALRMLFLNRFFKRPRFLSRVLTRFDAVTVAKDLGYMYWAVRKESGEGRF